VKPAQTRREIKRGLIDDLSCKTQRSAQTHVHVRQCAMCTSANNVEFEDIRFHADVAHYLLFFHCREHILRFLHPIALKQSVNVLSRRFAPFLAKRFVEQRETFVIKAVFYYQAEKPK
jgi:hypothetical protein